MDLFGYFKYLPVLETERLILRKMTLGDAEAMFSYSCDPEVARHVLWSAYSDISEARNYLRYVLRSYRQDKPTSWAMELKETGRMIGTCGFMWVNEEHRSAEVGYSMSREYWNRGLMTEALSAVLKEGFENMGLHRIEAQHEVDNPASGRVMEKCGMRCEGTLRGRLYNKGRYVDVNLWAILLEEYLNLGRVRRRGGEI